MRIIDINTLRLLFLDLLEDSRYALNDLEVNEVLFGDDGIGNHNRIYTEYGYYNEAIETVPETEEKLITPGLFLYDNVDIINNPNYDSYNVQAAFEFLGFERQREALRKLLEKYADDIRGKYIDFYLYQGEWYYDSVPEDIKTNGEKFTAIISVEMPVLGTTFSQSGFDRFEAYINLDFTVVKDLELDKGESLKIDGEVFPYSTLSISRQKVAKVFNIKTKESTGYAESQAIGITLEALMQSDSTVMEKIKRGILSSDYLNESYTINYEGYTYKMYLSSGSISNSIGTIRTITASFSTLKEV